MPEVAMAWRTSLKAKRSVLPQCFPVAYSTKSSTYLRTHTSRMLACPSTRERKQSRRSTAKAQPAGRPDLAW
eukprot:4833756-Amphidinium_carterae.1